MAKKSTWSRDAYLRVQDVLMENPTLRPKDAFEQVAEEIGSNVMRVSTAFYTYAKQRYGPDSLEDPLESREITVGMLGTALEDVIVSLRNTITYLERAHELYLKIDYNNSILRQAKLYIEPSEDD